VDPAAKATIDRSLRRRTLFEPPHARRSIWEITAPVETVGIEQSPSGKLLGARNE